LLGLFVRNSWW